MFEFLNRRIFVVLVMHDRVEAFTIDKWRTADHLVSACRSRLGLSPMAPVLIYRPRGLRKDDHRLPTLKSITDFDTLVGTMRDWEAKMDFELRYVERRAGRLEAGVVIDRGRILLREFVEHRDSKLVHLVVMGPRESYSSSASTVCPVIHYGDHHDGGSTGGSALVYHEVLRLGGRPSINVFQTGAAPVAASFTRMEPESSSTSMTDLTDIEDGSGDSVRTANELNEMREDGTVVVEAVEL